MIHFKHSKVISDIKELVRLLKYYQFDQIIELYQLDNLIGQAKNLIYNYDIDNLVFRISPSGMKPYPNVSKLSVIIKINYSLQSEMTADIDIFENYSLELFIKGYKDINAPEQDDSNFFCWHLDKEVNIEGRFIHPLYHFHAGGKRLQNLEKGELMLISSPRIPHPPMDIILAIHFVIQNFINSREIAQKNQLLADDNYINIIKRAQKRVLDPYFQTIGGNKHNSFTKQNLFPLYL